MAANTTIHGANGSAVETIAADEIGSIKFLRVKLVEGTNGVNDGDIAATNPLPVDGSSVTQPVSGPLTDVQLRAATVPISGSVTVSSAPTTAVTGPLTDAQLRATAVPISGTVTATGGGYLTDAQLRATAVPVSGTVTASGPLTDTQLRATAVPVSGTVTANPALGQGKTLLFGTIAQSVAGTTQLVAAQGGSLKIKVVSYVFTLSLAGTAKFTGAADLTGAFDIAASGGVVAVGQPSAPIFETAANAALSIVTTLGAGRGHISYFVEN